MPESANLFQDVDWDNTMFLDSRVGALVEPLTGRRWEPQEIGHRVRTRVAFLRRRGLAPGDRVFFHFGNKLELFVDLVAVWSLRGTPVPNKGGMKVYPADIDAVVERFRATTDVCSFAYEDALLGEDVGIAVVLSATDAPILRDLCTWSKQHLAKHKVPSRWYLLDEIPRTSRGKLNRSFVAGRCAGLARVDMRPLLGDASR